MEDLFKHHDNGQWELLEKGEPELDPLGAHIHFSDGTKKSFPGKQQAIGHLLNADHLPTDKNDQTWRHESDHKKTAKIVTLADRQNPRAGRRADSGTGPDRRNK